MTRFATSILAALGAVFMASGLATSSPTQDTVTPIEHVRGADQTFLTFPEWYLVYSPAEYAAYIVGERPSQFPYFAHIGQFWQSYGAVYDRIKNEFDFNLDYHVMVMVIGVSTTAEYSIKGAYELTIGRLLESTRTHGMTEEDEIGAKVAQDYVDFIYLRPWYEFDFLASLKSLWTDTSFFGPDMLRKLERKYILTSEYLVKAAYGWLIGVGTSTGFEAPIHETAVITDRNELAMLPRYQPFTTAALKMSITGSNFQEVAGNRGRIVMSLWAPKNWDPAIIKAELMFKQPIITEPGKYRHVIELDVEDLAEGLRSISASNLKLEHIYDF